MSRSGVVVTQWSGMSAIDVDITVTTLRAAAGLASLPSVPRELRELRFDRGRTARVHNAVMEEHFTAIRACTGAAAALADGAVPAAGGLPVFRCAVAHSAAAAIANPSQPSHSVNFYELVPTLDGRPFEPGTPLPTGIWRIEWTCPLYPEAHGGPASGAFHVGVGVPADELPAAWARTRTGDIAGAPGNLVVASLPQPRLVAALRSLAGYRDLAEQRACDAMKGFVATKAVKVRNAQPSVFDHDDALQEGMARLIVVMRRFAARGRPRACWSVAAGLVLERDLPRAADKVSHLSSAVAHCAHWLARTDRVDLRDPRLTPETAATAYARDQRHRRRQAPGTRKWLDDDAPATAAHPTAVWAAALDEARRGRPVSLDRLADTHDGETPRAVAGALVPVVDRDIELVGARTLTELIEDLLAGTGLSYGDLRAYLYPKLSRRGYADDTLRDRAGEGDAEVADRRLRAQAEDRLLALVVRPGESLARNRAVLRRRVRDTLFDTDGRFRPTEERRERWAEHRRATMAG
jgi:hypothetical protein